MSKLDILMTRHSKMLSILFGGSPTISMANLVLHPVTLALLLPAPSLILVRSLPLHEAAWQGNLEVARLLIDAGADPLMTEPAHGAAPIGFAAFARQQEMVAYLDQFGTAESEGD